MIIKKYEIDKLMRYEFIDNFCNAIIIMNGITADEPDKFISRNRFDIIQIRNKTRTYS
jgi:hypothetical protein